MSVTGVTKYAILTIPRCRLGLRAPATLAGVIDSASACACACIRPLGLLSLL
jgi:hypothetical protein